MGPNASSESSLCKHEELLKPSTTDTNQWMLKLLGIAFSNGCVYILFKRNSFRSVWGNKFNTRHSLFRRDRNDLCTRFHYRIRVYFPSASSWECIRFLVVLFWC